MVSTRDAAKLVFEAESMRRIMRMHQQTLGAFDPTDSIAAHSHLTSVIAFLLAEIAGADIFKTTTMAALHDLEEARTGDHNWVAKRYATVDYGKVDREQLTPAMKKLIEEFRAKQTFEAQLAKDADYIAQIVLLIIYGRNGCQEAWDWLHPEDFEGRCQQYLKIQTDAGHQLAVNIFEQNPHSWWDNLWTSE